jgi:uncharacterized protein (TIGR03083 family)
MLDNGGVNSRTNTELVAAVNDVLLTTLSICRDLTEADADLPTDCPGWTVRDQLAHMVGLEQVLQGAPQPDIELPPLEHVRNDFGVMMEQQVHIRRQLPLVAICDELDGLRRRRADTLGNLASQGDPDVDGPFGTRRLSQSLPIRVFDLWAHEQDIRRAVDLPVRDDCDAATISLERALLGWSNGLGKQLDGVDVTVVVDVTGPTPRREQFDVGSGGPTVTIRGTLGEITRAFCGRSGVSIEVDGPADLVTEIQPALGMTP